MVEFERFQEPPMKRTEKEIPEDIIVVEASDGRELAVSTYGDPKGKPVFLLHGSPGSRLGPVPRSTRLYFAGTKLITYDRPGYGFSTRKKGRIVADAAEDVENIADALGIGEFSVAGRSGGGSHALACAALLPHRVIKVAALASLAPKDELGWHEGMTDENVRIHDASDKNKIEAITALSEEIQKDRGYLLNNYLKPDLTEYDKSVISDPFIWEFLMLTYAEGVRQGAGGWIDDVIAFDKPWGFELSDINAPTYLWHGQNDRFSPPKHTNRLKELIPHATVEIRSASSHFNAIEVLPDLLPWLTEK